MMIRTDLVAWDSAPEERHQKCFEILVGAVADASGKHRLLEASGENQSRLASFSPVAKAQSMATAPINCPTTGPRMRKWRSWVGSHVFSASTQLSRMLSPPQKPMAPSTTSSLRWLRRFT